MRLEDYELDVYFDEIELNKYSEHTFNDKDKLFRENIVVIEEEWFDDRNLTYGVTFSPVLIKHAKSRIKQNNKFPCGT